MVVEDKQVGAGVLHEVPAEMIDQKGNVGGLAAAVHRGKRDIVPALVVKQQLETTAAAVWCQSSACDTRGCDVSPGGVVKRGCWVSGPSREESDSREVDCDVDARHLFCVRHGRGGPENLRAVGSSGQ